MESELKIVPAEKEVAQWVKNCVVVPEGFVPSLDSVGHSAIANQAFVDNSDDEAGDDEYAVQFPGHKQELLTSDGVRARIRELLKNQ